MLTELPLDVFRSLLDLLEQDELMQMTLICKGLGKEAMIRLDKVYPAYKTSSFVVGKAIITAMKVLNNQHFLCGTKQYLSKDLDDPFIQLQLFDIDGKQVCERTIESKRPYIIDHIHQINDGQIIMARKSRLWTIPFPEIGEPKLLCAYDKHYFVSNEIVWICSSQAPNLIEVFDLISNTSKNIELNLGNIKNASQFFVCGDTLGFIYMGLSCTIFNLTTKEKQRYNVAGCTIIPFGNKLVLWNSSMSTIELTDSKFNKESTLVSINSKQHHNIFVGCNCLFVFTPTDILIHHLVNGAKSHIPNHEKCCSTIEASDYLCEGNDNSLVMVKKIRSEAYNGVCIQISTQQKRNLNVYSQSSVLCTNNEAQLSDTIITINEIVSKKQSSQKKRARSDKISSWICKIVISLIFIVIIIVIIVLIVKL